MAYGPDKVKFGLARPLGGGDTPSRGLDRPGCSCVEVRSRRDILRGGGYRRCHSRSARKRRGFVRLAVYRPPSYRPCAVPRAANSTNAILRVGAAGIRLGDPCRDRGAKYIILINFLYERYVNKFTVDFYCIQDILFM
jgi:hypothetical protein